MNTMALDQLRMAQNTVEMDMRNEGSRELSLAFTQIQLTIFWLKKAYKGAGYYVDDDLDD